MSDRAVALAEAGYDQDFIDTNVLNVDNKGAQIAQDLVVTSAITGAFESAAGDVIWKLGGKQTAQYVEKNFISQAMARRIMAANHSNLLQVVTNRIKAVLASGAKKAATKLGIKAGGSLAASMARSQGATAACVAGPVGCAAATVYFVADLAFTIYNIILDVRDEDGLLVVFHRDYVDQIAEDYHEILNEAFKEIGEEEYMETEVLFYPENFLVDVDPDTGEVVMEDNEWVRRFNQLQDEYLEKEYEITGDWRSALTATQDLGPLTLDYTGMPRVAASNVLLPTSSLLSVCCVVIIMLLLL